MRSIKRNITAAAFAGSVRFLRFYLLSAAFATPLLVHGAPPPGPDGAADARSASVTTDLATLAAMKPRPCPAATPVAAIEGWTASAAQCAWQNRLSMRQWRPEPTNASATCLSNAARWWSDIGKRWDIADHDAVWNAGWPSQALQVMEATGNRLAIIERHDDGTLTASEWQWLPSPKTATRQWQQGRWDLLLRAAARLKQDRNEPMIAPDSIVLFRAWERSRATGVAEIRPDGWRWVSTGHCMRMETAGIAQAQLHLPYSRADSRLEQRAAMQLRLARTYPKAEWLVPFHMLPPAKQPASATAAVLQPGRAMYEALWLEDNAVKGQLWVPVKSGNVIHRARMSVTLDAPKARPDDPRVALTASVIARELTALAAAMAGADER